MKDPTLADLMKAATETILPEVKKTSARSNAPAFGIVNHDDGRRLTLNRELSEKLSHFLWYFIRSRFLTEYCG